QQPLPGEPESEREQEHRQHGLLGPHGNYQQEDDENSEQPAAGSEHGSWSVASGKSAVARSPHDATAHLPLTTDYFVSNTGTDPSRSSMMSAVRLPSTSASGRTIRRWPRTPWATAWTSSCVK